MLISRLARDGNKVPANKKDSNLARDGNKVLANKKDGNLTSI